MKRQPFITHLVIGIAVGSLLDNVTLGVGIGRALGIALHEIRKA